MTRVLVAYASRTGSTAEIAEAIGAQLSEAGLEVDVVACAQAPEAGDYDAVIIGSALYLKRWEKAALRYLHTQATELSSRPIWLFQSGPCGADIDYTIDKTPGAVRRLAKQIGADSPKTFGGRLEKATAVSRLGRWMATGALAGDFRDWETIRDWSTGISTRLSNTAISR
jgi:menaquinone-dependent protoporphyrinogen oxidase